MKSEVIKRDRFIKFRVTAEEEALIGSYAFEHGISISKMVRSSALTDVLFEILMSTTHDLSEDSFRAVCEEYWIAYNDLYRGIK